MAVIFIVLQTWNTIPETCECLQDERSFPGINHQGSLHRGVTLDYANGPEVSTVH